MITAEKVMCARLGQHHNMVCTYISCVAVLIAFKPILKNLHAYVIIKLCQTVHYSRPLYIETMVSCSLFQFQVTIFYFIVISENINYIIIPYKSLEFNSERYHTKDQDWIRCFIY